ncbi:B3 domain-containing protein Os12g0592300-like [Carex rostrata]
MHTLIRFFSPLHSMLQHIPNKFAKMLKGSMRENVELEGPSGATWHVKMIRSKNKFALQSGWKDFVTANHIDQNDILVFTYNGNYSFKVVIFDWSGCEKAAPFFAKEMETETESEESNDSLIRQNAAPQSEVKKEIISLSSGGSDTDESFREISSRATHASMNGESVCCKRKKRDFVQESCQSDSESDEGEHKTVKKRKTKKNEAKNASRLFLLPCYTHLTRAQEEIANRMVRKTQKGSDLFVKILTRTDTGTHRSCRLNLPAIFACEVLESKKKITLLPADLGKRSKACTVYYRKNNKARYICNGWRQFVHINGLKQGDLCLFELRKQDKRGILIMVVHFNLVSS